MKQEQLGNEELLQRRLVGFLSASKPAPLSVLPTLDWATDIAQQTEVAVMSGFHSAMEREVLQFLLRGKCGIVCVLARGLYKQVPKLYAEAYAAGRVLFVSHVPAAVTMASRRACQQRNAYIAATAAELVLSSVRESSSLLALSEQHPHARRL